MICDASGVDLSVILGQRRDKTFNPVYYEFKALNYSQKNHTVTEYELFVLVFSFENFASICLPRGF